MYAIIPLTMAGQKERFSRPNSEMGIYILEKFRENERKIKSIGDKLFEITIKDGKVSDELRERAKRLVAVEEELLDQAYTQAVAENKAFDRKVRIPGYAQRDKIYRAARVI